MRAAIFNPYLDTLGGGERYTLSFAKVLVENGYSVDLEWKNPEILGKLVERFGLNLDGIKVVSGINRGDGYDLCFWVSDGSIPALKARRNILHFQVPFHNVNGKSLINKMKLFRIYKIVCNSEFTKRYIDKEFGVNSEVLYPPIDTNSFKPQKKENIILNVARFSRLLQSKHQDLLIVIFKQFFDSGLKDWKLVLAGGSDVGDLDYTKKLIDDAKGYPIKIIKNPDFDALRSLYGKSKIFWSAAGFGENEDINPEKVEHFGITVVEAMASEMVPIVYNAGGFKEIIDPGINGYLWDTEEEVLKYTQNLITDKKLLKKISGNCKSTGRKFSSQIFQERVSKLID